MTFASVVIGSAMCSPFRTLISAWLSTSPLSAASMYGAAVLLPTSSLFTGCAFGSEMIPTLAQRVCPRMDTRAFGWLMSNRNNASLETVVRMARVLSPSSPISAAALYTNDHARLPAPTRTEPLVNSVSSSRPASNGATRLSVASKP